MSLLSVDTLLRTGLGQNSSGLVCRSGGREQQTRVGYGRGRFGTTGYVRLRSNYGRDAVRHGRLRSSSTVDQTERPRKWASGTEGGTETLLTPSIEVVSRADDIAPGQYQASVRRLTLSRERASPLTQRDAWRDLCVPSGSDPVTGVAHSSTDCTDTRQCRRKIATFESNVHRGRSNGRRTAGVRLACIQWSSPGSGRRGHYVRSRDRGTCHGSCGHAAARGGTDGTGARVDRSPLRITRHVLTGWHVSPLVT